MLSFTFFTNVSIKAIEKLPIALHLYPCKFQSLIVNINRKDEQITTNKENGKCLRKV